jgi:hypothetical protein|eukprot:COSAG06_NODE_2922_length_6086_cov_12.303658_9_plen_75_part_00
MLLRNNIDQGALTALSLKFNQSDMRTRALALCVSGFLSPLPTPACHTLYPMSRTERFHCVSNLVRQRRLSRSIH